MRARIAAGVVVGALVAFGATGCAFITPQATLNIVETSNGISGNAGDIGVRNATLISDNDGATANLLASFVNQGQRDQQLSVQYTNARGEILTTKVYVPAGQIVSVGAKGDRQITLTDLDSPAGSLFSMYFQTEVAPGKQLLVPVLGSDWQEYKGLQPTPVPTPLR